MVTSSHDAVTPPTRGLCTPYFTDPTSSSDTPGSVVVHLGAWVGEGDERVIASECGVRAGVGRRR